MNVTVSTTEIKAEMEYYHGTVRRQLEEQGFCGTCGRRTHKFQKRKRRFRGLWHRPDKKIPISIPSQVLRGRCLICHPVGRAEEPSQDIVVTAMPDTPRTHTSIQYELPPEVPLPKVRFRVQGSAFPPEMEKNERGETTKYYLMERGAHFGIELQNMGQSFVQAQLSLDGERAGLFDLAPGVEYAPVEQPFHAGDPFRFDPTRHGDGDDNSQTIECVIVPMALLSVRLPDQMTCFVLWDPEQSLQDLCEKVLHRRDTSHLVACCPQFGDPLETRDWIDSRDSRFQEATMQSLGLSANARLTLILRPAYLKMANLLAHQQMLAKTDEVLADIYSSDEDIEAAPLYRDNGFESSISEEEEESGDEVEGNGLSSSDESSAFAEMALAEVDSTSDSSEDDSIELTDERYEQWSKKMTKRQKKTVRLSEKKKAKVEASRRAKVAASKTISAKSEAAKLTVKRRPKVQNQGQSKLILDGAMSVTLHAKLSQYNEKIHEPQHMRNSSSILHV